MRFGNCGRRVNRDTRPKMNNKSLLHTIHAPIVVQETVTAPLKLLVPNFVLRAS